MNREHSFDFDHEICKRCDRSMEDGEDHPRGCVPRHKGVRRPRSVQFTATRRARGSISAAPSLTLDEFGAGVARDDAEKGAEHRQRVGAHVSAANGEL